MAGEGKLLWKNVHVALVRSQFDSYVVTNIILNQDPLSFPKYSTLLYTLS